MLDIITFGSASLDIFLHLKKVKIIKDKKFVTGEGIAFNLGSKIDVQDIKFNSGGGGTNTAATFSNQKFKTAFYGVVGNDLAGKKILEELKEKGINTKFVLTKKGRPTNHSIILESGKEQERTILVYRGASELLEEKDISWDKIRNEKPKWFYIAPLSGKTAFLTEKIISFAKKEKIKVALNPGNSQLSLKKKVLDFVLKKIDILFLNQEEASFLTKIPYQNEKEIFLKLEKLCPGIIVMTKGKEGVIVYDGKSIYQAKPKKIKVKDKTGAGDSFASGFVSGYIYSDGDIKYSIQFGIANANSCLQEIGAKNGLLKKGEKFPKVKVKIK